MVKFHKGSTSKQCPIIHNVYALYWLLCHSHSCLIPKLCVVQWVLCGVWVVSGGLVLSPCGVGTLLDMVALCQTTPPTYQVGVPFVGAFPSIPYHCPVTAYYI